MLSSLYQQLANFDGIVSRRTDHDPALIQPCTSSGRWYSNSPYATGTPAHQSYLTFRWTDYRIRGAEHLLSCTPSFIDGVYQPTVGIGVQKAVVRRKSGRSGQSSTCSRTMVSDLDYSYTTDYNTAFAGFLRVLHRHSPHTTSSPFLPSFFHTTYRASSNTPTLTPTPSPSTPTIYSKELDIYSHSYTNSARNCPLSGVETRNG